ncbi:hypothetical protein FRC11_003414, partial [Ceratobasidium sp. 423]
LHDDVVGLYSPQLPPATCRIAGTRHWILHGQAGSHSEPVTWHAGICQVQAGISVDLAALEPETTALDGEEMLSFWKEIFIIHTFADNDWDEWQGEDPNFRTPYSISNSSLTSTTEMEVNEWDIFGSSEGEPEDPPPPPIPVNVWGAPPLEDNWWGQTIPHEPNEWQTGNPYVPGSPRTFELNQGFLHVTGWDGEAVYDINKAVQLPEAFSDEDRGLVDVLLAIRNSWGED